MYWFEGCVGGVVVVCVIDEIVVCDDLDFFVVFDVYLG